MKDGSRVRRASNLSVFTLRNIEYEYDLVRIEDLPTYYRTFYREAYGEDLYPIEKFKRALERNPKIAYKVIEIARNGSRRGRLAGVFDIIPLTESGCAKLTVGRTRDGKLPLEVEDMARDGEAFAGIYIGGIASLSKDTCSRAVIMAGFQRAFEDLRRGRPVRVYARPVTKDGVRLLQQNGFVKLDTEATDYNSYWARSVAATAQAFSTRAQRA